MTAVMFSMVRDRDPSGISGTGTVGTVTEYANGDTVLHWDTATPSTCVYRDIRHIEALHGHGGATRLVPYETRLEAAWRKVSPFLCNGYHNPFECKPHPDHLDRLRLCFDNEADWRYYIALLDGTSDAATHEEAAGEMQHRWVDPSGSLWLTYATPLNPDDEHPLTTFDREDRG